MIASGCIFRPASLWAAVFLGVLSAAHGQTTYTYVTENRASYLNAGNWTPNGSTCPRFPGVDGNPNSTADGATDDIAAFGSLGFTGGLNISFSTSNSSGVSGDTSANKALSLGAFDFLSTVGANFSIRNSSSTLAGVLTLNGVSLNGLANTILANEGSKSITFVPNIDSMDTMHPMSLALGNDSANVIQVNGGGDIILSTAITGAGRNLVIDSTGTGMVVLKGINTYTGRTTIRRGTLSATTAKALTSTTAIDVNNGGTLLFGTSNQANLSAPITLGSATGDGVAKLDGGGVRQGDRDHVGLGALTLLASSTIDLKNTSLLHFAAGSSAAAGAVLTVLNWSGNVDPGPNSERIRFGVSNDDLTFLSQIQFIDPDGFDPGTYQAKFSSTYPGEVVPGDLVVIPEPAAVVGGLLTLAAMALRCRRRLTTARRWKTA